MDKKQYDFCGYATKANVECSDGRIIKPDAFKHQDQTVVPLVWNHRHDSPDTILGHALLENRKDGVYAYCYLNDSESGKAAKYALKNRDVSSLSIYANKLVHKANDVVHGFIREVSLVLAGANPEAYIETVIAHGEPIEDEAEIYSGELIELYHAEDKLKKDDSDTDNEETVADVFNTLTEKQKNVVYAMIGQALEGNDEEDEKMKHNVFDNDDRVHDDVLSHADQEGIIALAKSSGVGSLKEALEMYVEDNKATLAHGFEDITQFFPDYKDVRPGAPELLTRDMSWVNTVVTKAHKSPISRIRTRQTDIRQTDMRGRGYKKGNEKTPNGNAKQIKRTTDPQTVTVFDALYRDDIVDITDFDVVNYQYGIMRLNMDEEVSMAIMVGDGRDDVDEYKISEDHIRSIWHDDEVYTIHTDVDIAAARTDLNGTGTGVSFGDNYIYAEAIITAALYSREKYKGSGSPDFFCTPHLLNVMLLARDLNGRRIYNSKSDLAAALNVANIYTAEQFEGLTRVDTSGNTKKLLGIFVNLSDYHLGATKGGEISRFNQFDIKFNQELYLLETRLSGALTRVAAAIALEEPVAAA